MNLKRRPKGPFGVIDKVHALQSRLARLYGRPTDAMRTDLTRDGRPVIFLHNPKAAGKSLRAFLNVKRDSHAFASERVSQKNWLRTYSIVSVREPFERFLSGYYDRVMKQNDNALVRLYGPEFKNITPFDYLDVIREAPVFGGMQTLWSDYPSASKPRADLVLRYEEIDRWKEQMMAAGLDVGDREFPHLNRSKRADSDHLEVLGMSAAEFARLEARIRDYFRSDYEAFGYS